MCFKRKGFKSPYLKDGRLADVIAGLQILGSYKWASREAASWASKLDDDSKTEKWREIFTEHPEFFRINGEWASLRWRHALDKDYDPENEIIVKRQDTKGLTRRPLDPAQIEALINTAVELHNRAIEHEKERRWLTPILFSFLGIVIGVILQAALK